MASRSRTCWLTADWLRCSTSAARLAPPASAIVTNVRGCVDLALRATGGAAFFKNNELERLYRDVRAGAFHPPSAYLVHDVIAKTALGVTADNG